MNEWIMRVMPLPDRDRTTPLAAERVDLARFRIRILAPPDRPGGRLSGSRQCAYDVGSVRIIGLDSANPHGGVGGSFDTEQCAWLVREVEDANDRYVIVVSHDGSRTLSSDANAPGHPPRVRGEEMTSLLLARPNVIAWISNTVHGRAGRRHGDLAHGFWELPGATLGYGTPLAGGIVVTAEGRRPHRVVAIRSALSGESGPVWELMDRLNHESWGHHKAPSPR
jgi:hypothetical protein